MSEETVRYYGLTDADREAALAADSPARAAAGWRVSGRRTEFAFGKPGMNLVVTWVNDGAPVAGAAGAGAASPGAAAPGHFDLNAAIAAATHEMADDPARILPAPATAAPTFALEPTAPPPPAAATAWPVPEPAPEAVAEATPGAAAEPAAEPAPAREPEREPEPADRFEPEVVAPTFTPEEAAETFGRNGQDVVWLLDALAGMDRETAVQIARARDDADANARERALQVLTESFSKPPYSRYMKAAEDLIGSWVESVGATGNDEVLYDTVASAAIDAVDALIVQDELDSDSFATLYDPWGSTMEPDTETSDEPTAPSEDEGDAGAEFGPNTDLVIEFFGALQKVTQSQIDDLAKAGTADWQATLGAARHQLDEAVAGDHECRRQCDAARREVASWARGRQGARFDYSDGETSTLDRQAAQAAVVDAVQALVMADLLEPDDAKDLYSGWQYAVGTPALPEFEDEPASGDAESDEADANDAEAPSDLGPNGAELAELFRALASLTPQQIAELGVAVKGSDAERLDRSWGKAIEIAADKPEYRAQFEAVTREVMAWRDAGAGKYGDYQHAASTKADRGRARTPILRSAVALLYADLLDRPDAERLYEAWASVVGEPGLPEYSND